MVSAHVNLSSLAIEVHGAFARGEFAALGVCRNHVVDGRRGRFGRYGILGPYVGVGGIHRSRWLRIAILLYGPFWIGWIFGSYRV